MVTATLVEPPLGSRAIQKASSSFFPHRQIVIIIGSNDEKRKMKKEILAA